MGTKQIDDLDIQALVDAQLDWETEKRVWMAIKENPEYNKRYQELTNQKKALLLWWAEETGSQKRGTGSGHNGGNSSSH